MSWVVFYTDDAKPSFQRFRHTLTLVDEDGRARWAVPFGEVTYEQLLRSADGGTIAGDPRRPYLILLPPQGDGMMYTWSALLEGLRIARDVMDEMARVGGAVAFAKVVLDAARGRLGRGREALEKHYLDWKNADPHDFAELLGLGPWHGADLGERLGCSTDEAEAILWAYGSTKAPSGLWRRDEDDETARLVRLITDDLRTTQGWNPAGHFEAEAQRRIRVLLETGAAAPEPTYELPEYGDEDFPEDTEVELEDGLKVACGCGCGLEMQIYTVYPGEDGPTRVKFRYSAPTDHFDITPTGLGAILGALAR